MSSETKEKYYIEVKLLFLTTGGFHTRTPNGDKIYVSDKDLIPASELERSEASVKEGEFKEGEWYQAWNGSEWTNELYQFVQTQYLMRTKQGETARWSKLRIPPEHAKPDIPAIHKWLQVATDEQLEQVRGLMG